MVKFDKEIGKKKLAWKDSTLGTFIEQSMLYDEFIKMDLDTLKNRLSKSRDSTRSKNFKGTTKKKSF